MRVDLAGGEDRPAQIGGDVGGDGVERIKLGRCRRGLGEAEVSRESLVQRELEGRHAAIGVDDGFERTEEAVARGGIGEAQRRQAELEQREAGGAWERGAVRLELRERGGGAGVVLLHEGELAAAGGLVGVEEERVNERGRLIGLARGGAQRLRDLG